ncbi:MAG: cytochrome c [Calditrichaeota bacterium]|nr:MAG: cytochrome c [Calditrichota bacterium]
MRKLLNIFPSKNSIYALLASFLFALIFAGCRGGTSEKPPIHLNPNMDSQKKYKAQAHSNFFINSSTMRMPVAGTVARGDLRENAAFYTGKNTAGNEITSNALDITTALLARGEERYEIYCTPCHNSNGDGKGLIIEKGMLPPPNFMDDKVKNFTDGYIFGVISNGVRTMPSYRHQISVRDRWAIVAHLRKMQSAPKGE